MGRINDLPFILLAILVIMSFTALAEEQVQGDTQLTASDLLDKADEIFNSRNYEKSREVYMKALKKAKEAGQNSELTEAYAMIARTYLILDHKEEGSSWMEKAAKIAKPDEPPGWSRYLGVKGRFEWRDKEFEKATATFKEMYGYCSKHKLHERAIDAAHMVAITGTHEQQLEWGMKGITEAEAGNITKWLGPLWNNLGTTYDEMGKFQESLDAYLKAREYHWHYGDEKNKLIADWSVGHAYRMLGDLEQAGKWLRPVLAWCERISEIEFVGWTYKELAEIEIIKENYELAVDYLLKAKKSLEESSMPDWDPEGYKKLVDQIKDTRKKVTE